MGSQPLLTSPGPPHPSPRIKNGSAVAGLVAVVAVVVVAAAGPPGACGWCEGGAGGARDRLPRRVCSEIELLVAPFSLQHLLDSAARHLEGCRL